MLTRLADQNLPQLPASYKSLRRPTLQQTYQSGMRKLLTFWNRNYFAFRNYSA